jgi:beta-lactam-binding protein with PASTA domain
MKLSAAKAKLKKAGIGYNVKSKEVAAGDSRVGTVIAVNPKSGTKLDAGQKVDLTVATATGDPSPVVPDGLLGMKLSAAEATLKKAGIGYNVKSKEVAAGDSRVGTVIDVDPKSGTELDPDQKVTLTVAYPPRYVGSPDLRIEDVELRRSGPSATTCVLSVILFNAGDGLATNIQVKASVKTFSSGSDSYLILRDSTTELAAGAEKRYYRQYGNQFLSGDRMTYVIEVRTNGVVADTAASSASGIACSG